MKTPIVPCQFLAFALFLASCTLINPSDVKPGVGSPCLADSDCHAGHCYYEQPLLPNQTGGICTTSCQPKCPNGSVCVGDHCESILNVTALMVGTGTAPEDSWSYGHYSGIKAARDRSELSKFVNVELMEFVGLRDLESIVQTTQARSGRQLIVGNTIEYYALLKRLAADAPVGSDVTIYAIDDGFRVEATDSFASYWISINHAIFVAGAIAAEVVQQTRGRHRLGIISTIANPETVQEVNAFTLGARSVVPDMEVEVRYIGFWSDLSSQGKYKFPVDNPKESALFREEYLTDMLTASECQVIAHLSNTQRTVIHLNQHRKSSPELQTRFAFAKNIETACKDPLDPQKTMDACLGSIFINWTNVYDRIFRTTHLRGSVPLEPINYDLSTASPDGQHVGIRAGNAVVRSLTEPSLQRLINDYKYIDIWPRRQDGTPLTKSEINRMCFYVPGVIEKVNFRDTSPSSGYRNAIVPGVYYDYPAADPDWQIISTSLKEKLKFLPNKTDAEKATEINQLMHCQYNAMISQ